MPRAKEEEAGAWRLPRGRHRLPEEVVARSQRERLLAATIRVVAAKGYQPTTLADLTREAGVSRTTFYEHFESKEDCFLAAYDAAVDALARRVTAAFEAGGQSWPERMRAGLVALLEALAREPGAARLALVDFNAAGPAAQRRYRAAVSRLTPLFEEGRDFAPKGRDLPANTSRMAIGGVVGLVSDELLSDGAGRLRELLPEVLFAALSPYIGTDSAREVVAKGRPE